MRILTSIIMTSHNLLYLFPLMFDQFTYKILKCLCIVVSSALLIFVIDKVSTYLKKSNFVPTYDINRVQKGDTYRQFNLEFSLSPKECMRICLAEDECMAWNYIIPDSSGADGLCQLKHESTKPLIDLKAISGIARE